MFSNVSNIIFRNGTIVCEVVDISSYTVSLIELPNLRPIVSGISGSSIQGYGTYSSTGENQLFYVGDNGHSLSEISVNGDIKKIYSDKTSLFGGLAYSPTKHTLYGVVEKNNTSEIFEYSLLDGNFSRFHTSCDFYAAPSINIDGSLIAITGWNEGEMPFDTTVIEVIDTQTKLAEYSINNTFSNLYPKFLEDDSLVVLSDCADYYSLYRYSEGTSSLILDCKMEMCSPLWSLTPHPYAISPTYFVGTGISKGRESLIVYNLESKKLFTHILDYTEIKAIAISAENGVIAGKYANNSESVITLNLNDLSINEEVFLSKKNNTKTMKEFIDFSHTITGFKTHNPLKPITALIIKCHSGPTLHVNATISSYLEKLANRGFMTFEPNYRGSSGVNTKFRKELYNSWGTKDVEDIDIVYNFVKSKYPGIPIFLYGSSSGGFTTLQFLLQKNVQVSGCLLKYPVLFPHKEMNNTHRFERGYAHTLLPKYCNTAYHTSESICSTPIFLTHGTKDDVVPFAHSLELYNELKSKGCDITLKSYTGEAHGYRMKETSNDLLEREIEFINKHSFFVD